MLPVWSFSSHIIMPPPRRGAGALSSHRRPSSVRLSDVAYIGSNSKTKRPRKTKLCTGVPQVTCDSHTDKVKSQGHGAGAYYGGHLAAQLVNQIKCQVCVYEMKWLNVRKECVSRYIKVLFAVCTYCSHEDNAVSYSIVASLHGQ